MIKCKNLDEAAKYATLFAKVLRNYSYPKVSMDVETSLVPYRIWEFRVDGYVICVHLTEFYVNDAVIQNLQIYAKHFYCLPFHLYFKVAIAFLGKEGLVNFVIVKDGHVVSCWTKMKESGESGKVMYRNTIGKNNYMGIEYGYL